MTVPTSGWTPTASTLRPGDDGNAAADCGSDRRGWPRPLHQAADRIRPGIVGQHDLGLHAFAHRLAPYLETAAHAIVLSRPCRSTRHRSAGQAADSVGSPEHGLHLCRETARRAALSCGSVDNFSIGRSLERPPALRGYLM